MSGFLGAPPITEAAQRLFDDDLAELGYVMNTSRLWAHEPGMFGDLFALLGRAARLASLSFRDRGILVLASASTLGDSYCSLAWGTKVGDEALAAAVIRGDDAGLTDRERALATWARRAARDPNGISASDVQPLRDNGFGESQIFAITVFVALRVAFSTVNDALGAHPDAAYRAKAPRAVLDAVRYGRPISGSTDETARP